MNPNQPTTEPAGPAPSVFTDYIWDLTAEQRELLTRAGFAPWMLHPETSPHDRKCPHMKAVLALGNRRAFDAMHRADHALYREIIEGDTIRATKPVATLLQSLKLPEQFRYNGTEQTARGVFEFHYQRVAKWAARDFVRFVDGAAQQLRLQEEPVS